MPETTPQGYKTIIGIKEKKIEELETKVGDLTPEPKSAGGESFKESFRMLLSIVIAMVITYCYQRYPLLGSLQPDQAALVTAIVGVLIRGVDKFLYQWRKNRGQVVRGIGLDTPLQALANIMPVQKGKTDQMN